MIIKIKITIVNATGLLIDNFVISTDISSKNRLFLRYFYLCAVFQQILPLGHHTVGRRDSFGDLDEIVVRKTRFNLYASGRIVLFGHEHIIFPFLLYDAVDGYI
ncbi:hypothetical protein SDC9_163930 [bioreactor metagenome]|uniref:Uncharacterized protein n=1 Tax=bioreactor metagenome TaxID=1076179 RepID=A0A645FQ82_9ZZZZ